MFHDNIGVLSQQSNVESDFWLPVLAEIIDSNFCNIFWPLFWSFSALFHFGHCSCNFQLCIILVTVLWNSCIFNFSHWFSETIISEFLHVSFSSLNFCNFNFWIPASWSSEFCVLILIFWTFCDVISVIKFSEFYIIILVTELSELVESKPWLCHISCPELDYHTHHT